MPIIFSMGIADRDYMRTPNPSWEPPNRPWPKWVIVLAVILLGALVFQFFKQ